MAKDYVEIINDGSGDRYVRDAEAQAAIEQITDHAVLSVAGKTGNVSLDSSDVGLGNVGNFKAVSTEANQGLTDTEKSNARTNIGVPTNVSELNNDSGYTTNTGTVESVAVKMNGATKGTVTSSGTIDLGTVITDVSGKVDNTTTVNGHALSGNVTVTKSDVGLGNVTNDAQVKASEKGAASGVATLNSSKKVLIEQIPISVSGNMLIIG